MYSSSGVSTCFFLIPILVVVATQLLLMRTVLSLNMTNAYLNHKCLTKQGKYNPGSWYERQLEKIMESIASGDGFIHGYDMMALSKDSDSDYVGVTNQCRGDSFGSKCRSCFATAIAGLRRRCPRNKGAMIWYDQCTLEISSFDTPGKIEKDNDFCMSNAKKMKVDSFGEKWLSFLAKLVGKANNDKYLYGAGDIRFGTKKLYGMVQCRSDLYNNTCAKCVGYLAVKFQDCWHGKQGARVLGSSCNFRFELYPFVSSIKSGPNLQI
ncbi:PREDICTED: putative cysteine-rich repeat secretory protein 16 [Camelina sativa]|uniref:Cysteine-rich repeat secretory protein 16 n=1 Tax=Camelina sativa TaxID=90675 RepID=A0ABM1Q8A7_CAMSA|nr:PREDICTED: putative cysteine-rich repeat secretory protein 16 [Camelina sativa]